MFYDERQAIEKCEEEPKLKRTFNYEEDFEDLGIEADKLQRDLLTKKKSDDSKDMNHRFFFPC